MKKQHLLAIVMLLMLTSSLFAESVRFAVIGDTQGGSQPTNERVLSQIVDQTLAADPAVRFAVFTGDLIQGEPSENAPADFQNWRRIVGPFYDADFFGLKVYVTPGNHDMVGENYKINWQTAFPELPDNGPEDAKKLTYSFDAGPCHLVVVNTETPGDRRHEVDLEWLAADLAATDRPIKLVFGHDPAYPVGLHMGSSLDAKPEQRDRFWQILADNGVKAYFCGHEHIYDHWIKDGVHQIITGGGGGAGPFFHFLILDADDSDVTVTVHSVTNDEIYDTYKLSETDDVACDERTTGKMSSEWIFANLPCAWMIVLPVGLLALGLRSIGRTV
jgi:hypothetical protein